MSSIRLKEYFYDCSIEFSNNNRQASSPPKTLLQHLTKRLRKKRAVEVLKFLGKGAFYLRCFGKELQSSSQYEHSIYAINGNRSVIKVGHHKQQEAPSSDDRNTSILNFPRGFGWDMNNNMYICNSTCICKVDNNSNEVSLVAGHKSDEGYQDGNNDETRFNRISGILCYQRKHEFPLELYICDEWNHCIRMIDVTNGKTTTLAGKGEEEGDADGTLQSARFYCPRDIVKDDENDDILYVSEYWNHKIKMIDMKKGTVSTLVGNENDTSILNGPQQMQIIDSFIYVACEGFKDCIVRIDKHSKQVTKIKFSDGEELSSGLCGIIYHELDQCFYVSSS